MKSLYIIRHARALEKQYDQKDIDRELDPIGLQNSSRMGRYFYKEDILPDAILASSASRALYSASLIAEQINFDTNRIETVEEIYDAPVRVLLQKVNEIPDENNSVFLVGHNPGVSYLAEYITDEHIGPLTTCGVVKVNSDVDSWAEIGSGNCKVEFYIYPDLLNF